MAKELSEEEMAGITGGTYSPYLMNKLFDIECTKAGSPTVVEKNLTIDQANKRVTELMNKGYICPNKSIVYHD